MSLAQDIRQKALELGFDLVGITDASPIDPAQVKFLTAWLDAGCAADMTYMQRNLDKRIDPSKLLENAQSVIVTGLNYKPPQTKTPPPAAGRPTGRIAQYARYEDYHPFMKKMLRNLTLFLSSVTGSALEFKICVDSAPLAERALAARAGLGRIGKNHMLINPKLGPQILLGEIITNLKLPPDTPIETNCSDCDKCITACPTGALAADSRFDARRCISYLTIEHKGPVPLSLSEKIGDCLFGCDRCVLACPFQESAPICKNKHFKFHPERTALDLHRILKMTEDQFQSEFADSPLSRISLEKLKANASTCLTNINRNST